MATTLPTIPSIYRGESLHGYLARVAFVNAISPSEMGLMIGIERGGWPLVATRSEHAPEASRLIGMDEAEYRFRQIIRSPWDAKAVIVEGREFEAPELDFLFIRAVPGPMAFHKMGWMFRTTVFDEEFSEPVTDLIRNGKRMPWLSVEASVFSNTNVKFDAHIPLFETADPTFSTAIR